VSGVWVTITERPVKVIQAVQCTVQRHDRLQGTRVTGAGMEPLLETRGAAQVVEKKSPLYPDLKDDSEKEKKLLEGEAKEEEEEQEAATLPVILAVLAISFGAYIHGSSIVFADVALAGIQNASETFDPETNRSRLGYMYDETEDKAWIMGIASIGMVVGGLATGPLINSLGRRVASVLGIGVVFALHYTLWLVASHVSMLYIARFLAGLGLGISQAISTVYISEVSTPKLRSTMAVVPAMTGCLGVNSCQLLAAFLPWQTLAIVFAACNLPFVLMVAAMPESPTYLVARGSLEEAHKVLRRLRGASYNVTREVSAIERSLRATSSPSNNKVSLREWTQRATVLPLAIAFTLMFFFQMSGINLMLIFAITIFGQVGNLDKFLSQILVGSALFASNTLTLLVAGRIPRRVMLLTCSLGLSVTLTVMGFCYQIDDWEKTCVNTTITADPQVTEEAAGEECSYGLGLLPIFTAMVYIFMFNIGYGSLVWMTATEILPAHIRSNTNGLTVGWTGVLSFLTTFSFPYMLQSSMGGQGCFWMYSIVSFLGFLFIAGFVPETSGKTEEEISALFTKRKEESPAGTPSPIVKRQGKAAV